MVVPNALLIAAAAAGAPLSAGTIAVTGHRKYELSLLAMAITYTRNFSCIEPLYSIITIGFDSLSGYTFARVAQNYGKAPIPTKLDRLSGTSPPAEG